MKKIYGWTMVEMVVAMIILIILTGVCLTVYKPNVQKAKIVLYATMKNLTAANRAIIEGIENGRYTSPNELNMSGAGTADTYYCKYLAEVLSVDATGCNDSITLPGKIQITGLSNPWVTITSADFEVKDVLVSIEGGSRFGVNKFPLRIYNGSGYSGMVQVIDCTSADSAKKINVDGSTKDFSDAKASSSYSAYCGSAINYLTSNTLVSYDIYRADTNDEETTASLIATTVSPLEADCGAYGGQGLYNESQCSGYKLKAQCATLDLCANAGNNIKNSLVNPNGGSTITCATAQSTYNNSDISCFTLLHKPSAGTTFLLETMVGQFD